MNRAAILAALTAMICLVMAPAAMATARVDVACVDNVVKVDFNYQQFPKGPPASSHTSVRVDGGVRVDEVVSFTGPTHHEAFNYADLGDGRPHTIEARHQWIDRSTKPVEKVVTITCGEQSQPVAPEAPVAPPAAIPAPVAPPHPDSSDVPRRKAVKHHRRVVRERRHHGSPRHRTTSHRPPKSTG